MPRLAEIGIQTTLFFCGENTDGKSVVRDSGVVTTGRERIKGSKGVKSTFDW